MYSSKRESFLHKLRLIPVSLIQGKGDKKDVCIPQKRQKGKEIKQSTPSINDSLFQWEK